MKVRIIKIPNLYKYGGELNSAKWHDEGGPLFDFNNLKRDDYGLLTYNGTSVLSSEDSSRGTSEDKSTRRDTPFGYLVGDENLNAANLIWGGMELLPVVGNVMGIADVANDVYNIANSDNISSGDFGNLLLDIGGLIPGVSTITKGSKLAKAAKLSKAASKLDDAADALRYTSSKGVNDIKKRVKDAKDFALKSLEEATKAALSRNKEDLYKASMRTREAAKFNEGILNGVDKALDPFWTRYNIYLNVGTKADALNDIFGFMGSIEDNTKAFGGELNSSKRYDNGGPLEGLTPQERLNVALGRTPSGRPLEQGLIDIYPEMMLIPTGGMPGVSSNLGLSFGKKAAVKGLRGVESVLRNTDKIKKKVDNTVYDTIDELEEMATDGIPNLSETFKKVSNGTKKVYKKYSKSNLWPTLFLDENNNSLTNSSLYKEPLGEGLEEYAFGGELTHGGTFSNGVVQINEGGTHSTNPYDGIQVGVDELGIPNLVELDELIWNDYVFSNRLKVPKVVRLKYKLRGNKDLSFADAAKNILKESEERPNDPISLNGLDAGLSRLAMEQELIRMKKLLRLNRYDKGGPLGMEDLNIILKILNKDKALGTIDLPETVLTMTAPPPIYEPSPKEKIIESTTFKESPLRYAPIVGHAAGVISDIFSKPDYQASDEIRGIELNPSLVGFTPIGNRLRFTPYDINYLINKLNASSGASRRNIMNTSGGNRATAMAGLMGVDYNYTNALGDAYRQALEYNDARREAVETFNRATEQYNSEMGLKAAMANAESRNAMARARYERDKAAALLGQLARDAYNTRRSNNLNILLEDLGNLGRERNNRNWLDILADKGIVKMNTKGEHVSSNTGKNGGKLNRKKKGGFTYA